jgi:hypothetical protein
MDDDCGTEQISNAKGCSFEWVFADRRERVVRCVQSALKTDIAAQWRVLPPLSARELSQGVSLKLRSTGRQFSDGRSEKVAQKLFSQTSAAFM